MKPHEDQGRRGPEENHFKQVETCMESGSRMRQESSLGHHPVASPCGTQVLGVDGFPRTGVGRKQGQDKGVEGFGRG